MPSFILAAGVPVTGFFKIGPDLVCGLIPEIHYYFMTNAAMPAFAGFWHAFPANVAGIFDVYLVYHVFFLSYNRKW